MSRDPNSILATFQLFPLKITIFPFFCTFFESMSDTTTVLSSNHNCNVHCAMHCATQYSCHDSWLFQIIFIKYLKNRDLSENWKGSPALLKKHLPIENIFSFCLLVFLVGRQIFLPKAEKIHFQR